MDNPSCQECTIIAEEIAKAYAEAWASSDHSLKEAWIATYKMIGGTEEDAARAEELLNRFRGTPLRQLSFVTSEAMYVTGSSSIREAIMRKNKHQALTGHKIRSWPYS